MGSGKTSVGRRLAEILGWFFVDLDSEIERRRGTTIREIFRCQGEIFFRRLEREELMEASRRRDAVIALGGGTFCTPDNQAIVRATGASVWLDVPIELLFARCSGDLSRPLFTNREEMVTLLERRLPFYRDADFRLAAGNLTIDAAAERIRSFFL